MATKISGFKNRARQEEEPEQKVNGILEVKISEEESIGTIFLSGRIDQTDCDDITVKAMELIGSETLRGLIFDMSEVQYVSRAGMTMFSKLNLSAGEYEKSYQLMNLRADIAKVFQMMGYSAAFSITEKEDEE